MAWVLITLAAFLAGGMNAIAGGGTFIAFPALTGFGGLSEKAANITCTLGLWPGAVASVLPARDDFRRLPRRMVVVYSLISIAGGATGSWLLLHTGDHAFGLTVPWLLAFATLIFACSRRIAGWANARHGGKSVGWSILVGLLQGAVAIYGGYFGAGIGVLMLAGLSFTGLQDIHQMNALKVLLSMLINGVACIVFLFSPVNWSVILPMAVASTVGGFLGMSIARRIKQEDLRAVILVCGVALTTVYFVRNYGPILRHAFHI